MPSLAASLSMTLARRAGTCLWASSAKRTSACLKRAHQGGHERSGAHLLRSLPANGYLPENASPLDYRERDLPFVGELHVKLDASLLEHVELLAAFLRFGQYLSSLVADIAGEAGALLLPLPPQGPANRPPG